MYCSNQGLTHLVILQAYVVLATDYGKLAAPWSSGDSSPWDESELPDSGRRFELL